MTYETFWGIFWVSITVYRLVSTGALEASAAYWQDYWEQHYGHGTPGPSPTQEV